MNNSHTLLKEIARAGEIDILLCKDEGNWVIDLKNTCRIKYGEV